MFFKDSIHTLIIRVIGYFLALAVQVMVARFLGAGAKGELQITLWLLSLVGLLVGLGFERSIIYLLGRDKYPLKEIWRNACLFLLVSSILAGLILLPAIYLGSPIFGQVRIELLLMIFAIVPLERLFSFQLGVFNGLGQIRTGNLFSILSSFIYAGLVAMFVAWLINSTEAIMYSYFLAYLVVSFLVLWYWRSRIGIGLSLGYDREIMKTSISFGVKGQLGNITDLIATRLDILILNFYMGKAAAGVYSVALNFSDLLLFFPFVLAYVIFPYAARRDQSEAWDLTAQAARLALLGTVFLALAVALLAPLLITILFGKGFLGALHPLWILLPGAICISIFRLVASGISGLGYPLVYSTCAVLIIISAFSLNLVLVPKLHAIGAALASTISYCAGFLALLLIIKLKFKLSLKAFLLPRRQDLIITRDKVLALFENKGEI